LKRAAVAIDQMNDTAAKSALEAGAQLADRAASIPQKSRIALARAAFDVATSAPENARELALLIDGEIARIAQQETTVDGSAPIHLAMAAMLAARSGSIAKAKAALEASRSSALDHGYYDRAALWRTADCEARFAKDASARSTCLAGLVDGREYFQTHVALHLAYEAAGMEDKAGEQLTWLREHRGRAVAELENEVALIPNLLDARRLRGVQEKH
jgi:hypothetical protein